MGLHVHYFTPGFAIFNNTRTTAINTRNAEVYKGSPINPILNRTNPLPRIHTYFFKILLLTHLYYYY